MGVHDVNDKDLRHLEPIQTAVLPAWRWIVERFEDQAVRVVEVDGQQWMVADVRACEHGPAQLICIYPE